MEGLGEVKNREQGLWAEEKELNESLLKGCSKNVRGKRFQYKGKKVYFSTSPMISNMLNFYKTRREFNEGTLVHAWYINNYSQSPQLSQLLNYSDFEKSNRKDASVPGGVMKYSSFRFFSSQKKNRNFWRFYHPVIMKAVSMCNDWISIYHMSLPKNFLKKILSVGKHWKNFEIVKWSLEEEQISQEFVVTYFSPGRGARLKKLRISDWKSKSGEEFQDIKQFITNIAKPFVDTRLPKSLSIFNFSFGIPDLPIEELIDELNYSEISTNDSKRDQVIIRFY